MALRAKPNQLAKLAIFEKGTKDWLQTAEQALGSDRETYDMLLILFRDYTKQRLDYEGLINAAAELVYQHRHLINGLLQLPDNCPTPLSDSSNMFDYNNAIRAPINQKGESQGFYQVSPRTLYGRRTVPRTSYVEGGHEEEEEEPTVPLMRQPRMAGPGRPSTSKENRGGSLTDQEHANLFYIVQCLERHSDSNLLYLKMAQPKSRAPTPIPLFSSIRTKARRKRYKCLEDFIDHVALLWAHLGPVSEGLAQHFDYLVDYYFVTGKNGKLSSRTLVDSRSPSPFDYDNNKRIKCTGTNTLINANF